MCGVVGIAGKSAVNQMLFDALTMLQHRGQDAAGIVTCHEGRLFLRKDVGMVRDVFHTRHMRALQGNYGIGHVRYPTAGTSSSAEAQPFYVNSPYGITLAHNGNLTNAEEIHDDLFKTDLRHMNTDSDSEVLLNVFAHELQKRGKLVPTSEDIFHAVTRVHERCKGGYAVVAMITGQGVVGFRDPNGIRPLIYGSRETENGMEYIIASESVAITALGFKVERDIEPGEAVFIDSEGNFFTKQCAAKPEYRPCIFEYVYFARPDAIIDGISVYKARLKMGEKLAHKILREWGDEHDIDVVIPIPDTSRTSALELANTLGVKFREGFMKNRYIGRTFIMPGQQLRKKSVRQKLNPVELEFQGKNVLLVDDSIVRGTTCNEIIQMARDSGAKKVFFASAAPMVKYPNVYGIDMPAKSELIASERSVEEIREIIGADRLIFQDLEDLKDAVRTKIVPNLREFDCSVFDGVYVAGGIDEAYLDQLQQKRNDGAKKGDKFIDVNIDAASVDLTGVREV
ncbi:amidophosphoribosyltransferase [Acinetobacter schindleri]|jgi:amidophosphoribosyltransferase|uniref:Amidophosphoribosyltransferase n=3 Tax=Acinetobacter TaxID=469 RepID=A0AAE6WV29_9GAMM|nr:MULTISPECIES: amidophosphoribosyltransferase [Acinetobacter]ENV14174.1 amidophosphoribosyltransferase [Acinetobacter schindleri NIPH 900]ENX02176.1 amidophosphoribosyltransferase [Acinetobacter sp. CIP 101934]MCK8640608.1 amidophosphoribosyltransferase [Acinetobacter schindleri]MCO8066344.1 amidophosphoribosyltransferase [Acinetobacter schindleri]MCU4324516.1 amidophosphoribosyltransferase [Acinetobacter schindleri]